MRVNIAVCGKFHFGNYVKVLFERNALQQFYFSHRIGTAVAPGEFRSRCVNIWMKEYLVQLHQRSFGDALRWLPDDVYGRVWARGVVRNWVNCDLLHFMAHGHSVDVLATARDGGAVCVAEVVNTHPRHQREVLAREIDVLGLGSQSEAISAREGRLLDEVAEADFVLAPSEHVVKSFVERGVAREKIRKLPYAANIARFYPADEKLCAHHPAAGAPMRVICVGSISVRKGQLRLLEACRRLGPSRVSLTLVGVPSDEVVNSLRVYATMFRHIPRISNAELRDTLIQHDVFVLASLEEGLAVSMCEAMACGLPVIATRESGADELITDGENGLLIDAGDTEALLGKLEFAASNAEWRVTAGRRAAHAAASRANWSVYAANLAEMHGSMYKQAAFTASRTPQR